MHKNFIASLGYVCAIFVLYNSYVSKKADKGKFRDLNPQQPQALYAIRNQAKRRYLPQNPEKHREKNQNHDHENCTILTAQGMQRFTQKKEPIVNFYFIGSNRQNQ